jgi:hypothetical protein
VYSKKLEAQTNKNLSVGGQRPKPSKFVVDGGIFEKESKNFVFLHFIDF